MKKILAAVVFSTSFIAFSETSNGSLTTVLDSRTSQESVKNSELVIVESNDLEFEKVEETDFERESEVAPTKNQAKSKPEELKVLEELERIEASVKNEEPDFPSEEASEETIVQKVPETVELKKEELPQVSETPAEDKKSDSETKQEEIPATEEVTSIEENKEETTTEEEASEESEKIVPSRSVTIKNNQYLDVIYPGAGWAYIGEEEAGKHMTFFGRKLGKGDTAFTLRSKKSGSTLLHFYKNDTLTGEYIDDYLLVNIEEDVAKTNGRITAPSYADIVPQKPEKRLEDATEVKDVQKEEQKNESSEVSVSDAKTPEKKTEESSKEAVESNKKDKIKTVIENTTTSALKTEPSRLENIAVQETVTEKEEKIEISSENLLENAQKSFNDGKFETALVETQEYLAKENLKEDEALFLLGQIYESESPVKNIRSSIDSYDTLVRNFPSSPLWKKANQRSIYLKRFYIDIR